MRLIPVLLLSLALATPTRAVTLSNIHWQQTPVALELHATVSDAPGGLNLPGGWLVALKFDDGAGSGGVHWYVQGADFYFRPGDNDDFSIYDAVTGTNPALHARGVTVGDSLVLAIPALVVGQPTQVAWSVTSADITPASA